jgi:hypothetical protein
MGSNIFGGSFFLYPHFGHANTTAAFLAVLVLDGVSLVPHLGQNSIDVVLASS